MTHTRRCCTEGSWGAQVDNCIVGQSDSEISSRVISDEVVLNSHPVNRQQRYIVCQLTAEACIVNTACYTIGRVGLDR